MVERQQRRPASQKIREIEVEGLKTPKGTIPTMRGLETAINYVYTEITGLNTQISLINTNLNKLGQSIDSFHEKLAYLSEALSKLVVQIAQNETKYQGQQDLLKNHQVVERADLLALKEELAKILNRLDQVTENES
ncbi:MAG: hypothetical protein ACFFE8_05360 [Candidatus Heimdallarchaeota archaeon]